MLRHKSAGLLFGLALACGISLSAAAAPQPKLVFTEILPIPPASLQAPLGQWFELYNASEEEVDLAGCLIQVGEGGTGLAIQVVESVSMASGAYLVLGPSKAWALNGGIPVQLAVGPELALPPVSGFLRVLCNNSLVDEVTYGPEWGLTAQEGVSLALEPSAQNAEANDDVTRWCPSTTEVSEALVLEFGTPGGPSASCDSDRDGASEDQGDCNDFDPMVLPGMFERCNGVDDDCDGSTDEEPLADAPSASAVGACADLTPVCQGAAGYVWPESATYEEEETSCDNIDNDCDGWTDEELRNACGGCGEPPADDCNGVDDDCDGLTDEEAVVPAGFTCTGEGSAVGVCVNVVPQCNGTWTCLFPLGYQEEETLCDTLDNDCDGETDEGFSVGAACSIGQGSCLSQGTLVCATDPAKTRCAAPKVTSTTELCGDDIDNDCDGLTDEGFFLGEVCYSGLGGCRQAGKYFCSSDGLYAVCSAEPIPASEEVCDNNLDDDCDGFVDELPCTASVDSTLSGCSATSAPPLFCVRNAFPISILIGLLAGSLWVLGRWALNRNARKRNGVEPDGSSEVR